MVRRGATLKTVVLKLSLAFLFATLSAGAFFYGLQDGRRLYREYQFAAADTREIGLLAQGIGGKIEQMRESRDEAQYLGRQFQIRGILQSLQKKHLGLLYGNPRPELGILADEGISVVYAAAPRHIYRQVAEFMREAQLALSQDLRNDAKCAIHLQKMQMIIRTGMIQSLSHAILAYRQRSENQVTQVVIALFAGLLSLCISGVLLAYLLFPAHVARTGQSVVKEPAKGESIATILREIPVWRQHHREDYKTSRRPLISQ